MLLTLYYKQFLYMFKLYDYICIMTYEQRRDLLLKTMRKQTDQWLQVDKYEDWQKKNKPKQSYTFKPKRTMRTSDIYNKECLKYYQQQY